MFQMKIGISCDHLALELKLMIAIAFCICLMESSSRIPFPWQEKQVAGSWDQTVRTSFSRGAIGMP